MKGGWRPPALGREFRRWVLWKELSVEKLA
jgi:hypothetical protein